MHYFACSGGTGMDSIKSAMGHITRNISFCIRCIRGVKRRSTISLLELDRYRCHKKCIGTPYIELVFLHPVLYVGHIVHSGASGAQNVDAIFFILVWDWYGFHRKLTRTH
jgi:hypothetical protein